MALTKEQKKALKEAKKLEKLRAEEELRRKLKIEELQRELVNQTKNKARLEQGWRNMVLKIKIPVLRQDVEVMWHVFERALDKKDHCVKYTMDLMKTADSQVSRTISSFCDTVDTMINKFLKDLDALSDQNELQTKALLKQGDIDANKITRNQDEAETHLQLLIYHSHTTADVNAWSVRGEDFVKQDEDERKKANIRDDLRSDLENVYNVVWDEYKMVLRAYVTGTVDIVKKLRILRAKESKMAEIIESQRKRITNNDNVLKYLRNELLQYESGAKQLIFRDRRKRHRNACGKLKNRLVNGCAKDTKQLASLVLRCDETIDWLSAGHQKGEKILKLAALCRRLETRKEKVFPFGSHFVPSHMEIQINGEKTKNEDTLIVNSVTASLGLNRLWQRIAMAELSIKALLREKDILDAHNSYLCKFQNRDAFTEREISVKNCICSNELDKGIKSKIYKPAAIDGIQAIKYYNSK